MTMTKGSAREANQRLFDESLAHIREQGEPSMAEDGLGCLYSSANGLGCAFAPAIETYNEDMEGEPASSLLAQFSSALYGWTADIDGDLADAIQSAHDDVSVDTGFGEDQQFPELFELSMADVAEQYELDYAPVC